MRILSIVVFLVFGSFFALAQDENSCSHHRDVCRLKCLPKSCVQDGVNCNEGRQACVKYCAQQFLETECASDSGSIQKPGRCKKMVSNYWPGGKVDSNSLKATCSSESDCLNLISDLILHCGASPVCPGSENKKVSPLDAATCALKDAEYRLRVQKAGCGGYICRTKEGFRGDKEFFLSSLISKETPDASKKAEGEAKKNFAQICRANLSKPEDVTSCLAAANVSIDCKYAFNLEGDGCLYDEAPASTKGSQKAGGAK